MALDQKAQDDIRDNVARILEANGLFAGGDLVQSALGYVIAKTPSNFVIVHESRLLPDDRHALSHVVLGVSLSIGDEDELPDVRTRLALIQHKLVEVG